DDRHVRPANRQYEKDAQKTGDGHHGAEDQYLGGKCDQPNQAEAAGGKPPKRTSRAGAATFARTSAPPDKPLVYSPMPTRVAASAPNAWLSAMRCGIAVIGTHMPSGYPAIAPTAAPTTIHS